MKVVVVISATYGDVDDVIDLSGYRDLALRATWNTQETVTL